MKHGREEKDMKRAEIYINIMNICIYREILIANIYNI